MNRSRIALFAVCLMLASAVAVCAVSDDSDASVPEIQSVSYLSQDDVFLVILTGKVNGSDPLIVATSSDGKLVAQGGGLLMSNYTNILLKVKDYDVIKGYYTISIFDGDGGSSAKTVFVNPVTGVSLDKSALTIEVGKTATLNAIITPDDAVEKGVVWTSDDKSVATVSPDGVVRALKVGTAQIKVTTVDGNYTSFCTVTVTGSSPGPTPDPPVDPTYRVTVETDGNGTASVSPNTAKAGTTITLTATPNEGYVFKAWETSSGVTITGNTFTMPSKNVTIKAIFEKPTVTVDVSFDRTTASLNVGDTTTIKATVTPADAPDKGLVWSASDPSVVTVDDGVITAVGPGTAKVTATTVSGKTATCTVTVILPDVIVEADDGQISGSKISAIIDQVYPGQNVILDAKGSDSLTIDVDSVDALLEKGAIVTINTDSGSVDIPKGSLVGVPTGQPMVVTLTETEVPSIHTDRVPEGSVVVDVTITVGDMIVTTFGTPITVSIPVGDGYKDASNLKVYHLADDGTMTDMDATYDAATHSMVFQTGHLSVYAIVEVSDEPAPSEDKDNTMLYIGIAVVILVVIVLAAVLVTRRRY